ncbi:alcohol dehydrogenase catalytic domain-containing protein [Pseudomonas sp. MPFS]|uniref:zinc-dependent alcohol dehydrogenase n=1 Tax=Pseudomonas sp. MPFS TaxID=2795724 RepID=UPI001F13ED1A|nr:alcohol dehydrogenase catalytic domain-containing protein [Pseudomonas sp. MPFS]UMZ14046.1 alcohol dehydrogenase catalytic domain-containing protein [Pseudomonas sp. MPFS]
MKALIYDGERVNCQDVQQHDAKLYPHPIKIKIQLAGICSTDLKIIDGKYYNKTLLKPNGILGHEGCGRVAQSSSGSLFKAGDHVVFETVFPCQKCAVCVKGLTNYCSNWLHIGINTNGTFSEYLTIDESMVHKISKDIPPQISVLAEPLSIALNSTASIFEEPRNKALKVAVVGPGILGLLHTLLLAERDHSVDIFGISSDDHRLEKALSLGAKNAFRSDAIPTTMQQYDLVIDSSNTSSGAAFALGRCKPGGHLRVLNLSTEKNISSSDIVKSGCCISTSKGIQNRHMVAACNYIETNSHKLSGLTTHFFSPHEYQQAFNFARSQKGIKSAFNFN